MSARWYSRFVLAVLVSGLFLIEAGDAPNAQGRRAVVSIERGRLSINGKRIRFPLKLDNLRAAMGRESRIVGTRFLKVHIWDGFGISAIGLDDGRGSVDSLKILLGSPNPRAAARSPRSAFPGRLLWNGRRLNARSGSPELRRALRGRRLEANGSQKLVRYSEMTLNVVSVGKILINEIEIEAARSR